MVLVLSAQGAAWRATALAYGLSTVFLFGASAIYHGLKTEDNSASIWRRLDHSAIFFMIAGSYTPICWVHLDGAWRWSILGTQWGLAITGTIFKFVVIRTPRWLTVATYLCMGWIAVIPIQRFIASMETATMFLIAAGGLSYTFGAVIYATERPDPVPGRFGFHEIFHICVLGGAALHYIAVFRSVG